MVALKDQCHRVIRADGGVYLTMFNNMSRTLTLMLSTTISAIQNHFIIEGNILSKKRGYAYA
ncbi:hypothetical protein WH47_05927 [Habropoda laboriosa]|uniref:Uncharacterized protein n=1 Tax=Habropoda laboriosa TaxID=597456 RepID=A0A0L7REK3_9HYME|nr:hypothetical protein WH47_05927 [Habropoda laboriosa]